MYPSDDESGDSRMMPSLSDDQVRLLALLFVVSGSMSLFGSFIIIHRVVRNRDLSKSYDRIMLGLSGSDVVATIAYMTRPFLLPKATSTRVTAVGNDVTCTLNGWLNQFGFAAIVYNAILSFYMLAVVRFSVKPSDFAARFEPYMHGLTILYFLATATFAVPFGVFSELDLGLGCWVMEIPECEQTGRHCFSRYLAWMFAAVPLVFTFAILVVNNILIIVCIMKSLRIEGQGRTRAQSIQVRRVATQGFLYVGAFFFTYFPGFAVRMLGLNGHGLSSEAELYKLLILQSSLCPLQGFFNMLIYIRPAYWRLRQAGASRWVAMRGACFAPNISKLLSEVTSMAPGQAQQVPKEVVPDEHEKESVSSHNEDDDQLTPGSAGGTEDDGDSGEDFVEADYFDESRRIVLPPASMAQQPAKSILKSNSTRVNMDGSISKD